MKLNLGCGFRPILEPEWINIDIRQLPNIDLVCDLSESIPFRDNSIDYILAHDFMEHLPRNRFISFMEEVYRVLKIDGILDHFSPSTDGRGYAMDPTHTNPININSFWYFQIDEYRNLYNIKAKFSGTNKNILTDPANKIIHVAGKLKKVPL